MSFGSTICDRKVEALAIQSSISASFYLALPAFPPLCLFSENTRETKHHVEIIDCQYSLCQPGFLTWKYVHGGIKLHIDLLRNLISLSNSMCIEHVSPSRRLMRDEFRKILCD